MEPLRLDPADPLASVLRWLAALARALGIDPARLPVCPRLSLAGAAAVRGWLAAWSRQLRSLVALEAARLVAGLRGAPTGNLSALTSPLSLALLDSSPARGGARDGEFFLSRARGRWRSEATPEGGRQGTQPARAGRFVAILPTRRSGVPVPRGLAGPRTAPPTDVFLNPAEEAALRRRSRAVLAALRDPGAAIRRLALRIALRRARLLASRATRRRFAVAQSMRTAWRTPQLAPALRPPDR